MLEVVAKYWVTWACSIVAAALLTLWSRVITKRLKDQQERAKTQQEEINAMQDGIKAILHDRLFREHRHFMAQGWCSLEEKKNLEYLYKPYHALGGNGTGDSIYEDILSLPTIGPQGE